MSRRNIVIVLVVILALGAGLLAYGILTAPKKTAETRPVVTALAAIPAKSVITPAMIAVEQRDVTAVPVDAAAGAGDVVGYTSTADIAAGDVIESTKLQKVAAGPPVTVKLDPGMRAVTIPVDLVKSVAGLAVPGDHVDVIAVPPRVGTAQPQAFTILRDVKVLSLNRTTIAPPQEAMPAAANPAANAQAAANPNPTPTPIPEPPLVVTLQVTPAQANLLVMADLNSNLRLALRPPQEPARSQPVEALVFPVPEVAKAPGGPGGKPTSTHPGVTVINGDTIEGP